MDEEQAAKLELAIKHILDYCKEDADEEEFRLIHTAIVEGDELVGEILEGSTNFSYRVYLKGDPSVRIFVKVAFDYARWNPDRSHYALDRITTEYSMMKRFSRLLGPSAPVATPYLCVDIAPKIRMMVTKWAPSHEPWAHQFIRGDIDRRIVRQVARFIATVNKEDYGDRDLNDGIKDSMRAIYPITKGAFAKASSADGDSPDHFTEFARDFGAERFDKVVDAMAEAYESCNVLLHGDTHALNILVEPVTSDGSFGAKGEFFMCDWEMVHAGSKGRDPGTFCAWPILCSYFLAARGEKAKALCVIDRLEEFWDTYATHLKDEETTNDANMQEVYRSSVGWCGLYLYIANYLLGVQRNYMPFDLVSKEAGQKSMASVALTGVKCMEFGFLEIGTENTLVGQRKWFRGVISDQIDFLLDTCEKSYTATD